MKLITLSGKVYDPLIKFLQKYSKTTDIFCFQEILKGGNGKTNRGETKSSYEDIENIFTDYIGYFSEYGEGGYYSESSKNLDFDYGVVCFVKKSCKQSFVGGVSLYNPERKWNDYSGRFAAGSSIAITVSDYVIVNVHGLWQGSVKVDTEARLEQSKRIIDLANKIEGKKIICGDFNLEPHTESIKMIESLPMKNLIKEYKVTSTRSSFYDKDVKFSDYVFVDYDVNVLNFQVLPDEVSDHLPLLLEFE